MKNVFVRRQPDGQRWQIAFEPARVTDVPAVTKILEHLGMRPAPRLDRILTQILGPKAKTEMVYGFFLGRQGRCMILMHRRTDVLFLSWHGAIEGEEFASLILSNIDVFRLRQARQALYIANRLKD